MGLCPMDGESEIEENSTMQIEINTDHNIEGREALSAHIREVVGHTLAHEAAHITRIEVHVSDENGPKSGPDTMRCTMEARLERHQPLNVAFDAGSMHQAIAGAADKLAHLVRHALGKARTERRRRTDPPLDTPVAPAQPG